MIARLIPFAVALQEAINEDAKRFHGIAVQIIADGEGYDASLLTTLPVLPLEQTNADLLMRWWQQFVAWLNSMTPDVRKRFEAEKVIQ